MSRLAQVGGARIGRKLRPESVDDLLPGQPMPRRQGEQLHELGRAPLPPCASGDATSIDRDLERTEDADLDARHTDSILPTTPADKDAMAPRARCARCAERPASCSESVPWRSRNLLDGRRVARVSRITAARPRDRTPKADHAPLDQRRPGRPPAGRQAISYLLISGPRRKGPAAAGPPSPAWTRVAGTSPPSAPRSPAPCRESCRRR